MFLAVVALSCYASGKCPYVYGYSTITTPKLSQAQIAGNLIDDIFTSEHIMTLVVPAGDYGKEAALLQELDSREEIDHTVGLANLEAMEDYALADQLTPRQFSELMDLDYEMAQVLYAAYATDQGD